MTRHEDDELTKESHGREIQMGVRPAPRCYDCYSKHDIMAIMSPESPVALRTLRIFGTVALVIGISLILLIIWAEILGYR